MTDTLESHETAAKGAARNQDPSTIRALTTINPREKHLPSNRRVMRLIHNPSLLSFKLT